MAIHYEPGRGGGMVQQLFSCDIETTGLDPFGDSIIGVAFSNQPGFAVHFDWPIKRHINELFEQPLIFQNGVFDAVFLRQHGIPYVNYTHDTRWMQHCIAPELPKSLAFFNSLYSPYPYYKEYDDKDSKLSGRKIREITTLIPERDLVRQYCCRDADVTFIVAQRLLVEMKLEGVEKPYNEIMMPLARCVVDMRLKGIQIDLQALEDSLQVVKGQLAVIEMSFNEKGWNIRSPVQIRKLLNDMGIPVRDSVDKEVLDDMLLRFPGHPILAAIRLHRRLDVERKTYEGVDQHRHHDIIHPDWDISGTRTGRMACKEPNVMNISEPYRHIIIPRKGMKFIQGDYSRLELKVAAARSHDTQMIEDTWNKDIHGEFRKRLFGAKDSYSLEEKLTAKRIVFGALYGRSARSIALSLHIPVDKAQQMIDSLTNAYPEFAIQMKQDKNYAINEGKITTPFGRIRHFFEGNVSSQGVNTPIQSTAADITFKSLIKLHESCQSLEGYPIMSIHDSIILEYPEGQDKLYLELMKDTMESPVPELDNRRFSIDIKTGHNWRDMESYNG